MVAADSWKEPFESGTPDGGRTLARSQGHTRISIAGLSDAPFEAAGLRYQ